MPNVFHQIIPAGNDKILTKQDYANLRRAGFTELIAIAQTQQHVFVEGKRITQRRIEYTGIDTYALLSYLSVPKALSSTSTENDNEDSSLLNTGNFSQLAFSSTDRGSVALLHPELHQNLIDAAKVIQANDGEFKTEDARILPQLQSLENAALGNDIIMDISNLFALYPDSQLSSLLVIGELSPTRVRRIKEELPEHLSLQQLNTAAQTSELTNSFHLNLMAMALLMFVVCLFIVVNAVNLLLHARLAWLKICRQLGIGRQQLFLVQLCEVVILTLIATIAGMLLGIELAKLASPTVQSTLENLYQVNVGFGNISLTGLFIQVFFISLLGCVAASILPLQKLNQDLSSTKSSDHPARQKLWTRITWGLFIAFSFTGFLLLNFAQALWMLLIATACVILAGCCVLLVNYPLALKQINKLIPSSMPLLSMSAKQSMALSGKTKIACCAFFIAATSNIGMNLMVDSFRGATFTWLEQRLSADYYIYSNTELGINDIAAASGVIIHQRFDNYTKYQGKDIQQFSYPSTPRYQEAMSFYDLAPAFQQNNIQNLWASFEEKNGVLINQQFAFGFDVGAGDQIAIPHPSTGQLNNYLVLGIIYDFGNPSPQVLMPVDMFDPSTSAFFIYSIQANPEQLSSFKKALEAKGLDAQDRMISTSELLKLSMKAFDDTFIITDGLNIVTLLVAALSLACAIVVIMNDVRPQNMLVRSLGVSAFKTQILALFQYLLLCFVALIFATPFGILLSWVLIFEINYQAFSWTYPLLLSASKIAKVYVTSLCVVCIVIAIPLIRAGKRPLISDIRQMN
ncbi:ABC transporter permease [Glaciecola sp. MH2013]|uniref:ABC transporter permease n=1 Tax=Glaciecola sp. MH2013 TaxID=2785524 RepID=UPI001E2C6DD6|nr:ABC transporter permease [Glaciecola sp. MH2013]